jgi:phosphomannomutase
MRLRDVAPDVGFGTSGVRALVADLTPAIVVLYTRAFVARLRESGEAARCVVGWDLRPSSPDIAAAVCVGLQAEGVDVEIAGPCLTPALALRCLARGAAGIMVTGSHIPFDRNGVKFYTPRGEITKADEAAISSADVSALAIPQPDLSARLACVRKDLEAGVDPATMELYAARYLDAFKPDLLAGLRVGVYQHSAVSRDFLPLLLAALGADVVALGRSESFVPIDTEAVSHEDEAMAGAWARAHRLDAVVSTDGDGDRPWICDEQGRFLRGDVVGVLCAWRLGVARIVTPVSSNSVAEASGFFDEVARTRIGSPFVLAGMEEAARNGKGAVAGFEANGGFLLQDPVALGGARMAALPTRDSTLPILAILALAAERRIRVSQLPDLLPARRTASGSIKGIATASALALIERLRADGGALGAFLAFAGEGVGGLDTLDGLRATMTNGAIVHLRPSGNAPEFRCYTEAATQEEADRLLAAALARIADALGHSGARPAG